MSCNKNKYYTKYNTDIKSIYGSGVITKRGPPDADKTVGTIREVLVDGIDSTPPLYPRTWDNDPQQTSGYLNDLDYIDYVPDIDKYYYTAQQIDHDIDIVKNKPTKTSITKKNSNQIVKLPPPLITTNPDFEPDNSEYAITNKKDKPNVSNGTNGSNGKKPTDLFKKSNYSISQNDINKSWYDGRYLYTFSPSSLETIYPWATYNLVTPYGNKRDIYNYYQDTGTTKLTSDPLLRDNNPNEKEFFGNSDNKSESKEETKNNKFFDSFKVQDINMMYLALLCLILIIYFIRNK
jgi:hypothetical protein